MVACYENEGTLPDIDEVFRIALMTGGHSRLYKDPLVDRSVADEYRLDTIAASDAVVTQEGGFLAWNDSGESARISTIAVLPEYQGKGVGSNLLRAWLTMMVGRRKVYAGTQSDNRAARSLYERHGFEIEEEEVTLHLSQ
jgi:ribosomal protein S18 acetylase RimI-like enzyme